MEASPPTRTQIRPELWLDARLALWVERARLLVIADIHWGYAASHRAQGNLLPLWGDDEIARRLDTLVRDYQPREMLWLGDSVHTPAGRGAAEAYLETATVPITVLAGNHDRQWERTTTETAQREDFFFHHGDAAPPPPAGTLEVVGHHHPAVSWRDGAGGRLKLPALVASATRMILPAFSPWAAGAPWNGRLLPDERIWAVAPRRIIPFTAAQLASSALTA
jgi:metallophosphoesterase superfamily enzyme